MPLIRKNQYSLSRGLTINRKFKIIDINTSTKLLANKISMEVIRQNKTEKCQMFWISSSNNKLKMWSRISTLINPTPKRQSTPRHSLPTKIHLINTFFRKYILKM